MAGIVYPASLPCPVSAPYTSTDRRFVPTLPGAYDARPSQRDRLGGQPVEFIMTSEEAAVFITFGRVTLFEWGAWFAASWPLPQGGVGVRRFIGAPSFQYVAKIGTLGGWRISARVEVRGRTMQPEGPSDPEGLFEYAGPYFADLWFASPYEAALYSGIHGTGFADVVMAPDLGTGWYDIDGAGPSVIEQRLASYRGIEQNPADGFPYYINRRPL